MPRRTRPPTQATTTSSRDVLPSTPARLAGSLAEWFAAHKRDLPWRHDRSAYRVWLSEVMLQQTRVSVVEEYYRRFLARFPDVASLAAADEDEVLALWSGLGYYTRGRNLHRAARAVVDEHGGVFPRTAAALGTLPGVGPYTAAAIASLAHEERAAVVDGNVARVLMRLCGDDTPIDTPDGKRALAARAQALIDAAPAAGGHNEAVMELGALVCTPKSPACGACPWRRSCVARRDDRVAALPKKARKAAVRALDVACLVVVAEDRVRLERKHERGLFGGLYAPPVQTLREDTGGAAGAAPVERRAVHGAWRALARELGVTLPRTLPEAVVVRRQLTHRDLTFHVLRVDVDEADAAFLSRAALKDVGLSAAVRAVLDAVWAAPPAQPGLFS